MLEERLFTSPDYLDEMLMCEDELIDSYIGGSLSPEEMEAFQSHFLLTPERRQKLKFARTLKRYVAASAAAEAPAREAELAQEKEVTREKEAGWLAAFVGRLMRPAYYAPLAAALLLLVAYGSWQLAVGWRQQRHRTALEAELSELNREQTEGAPSAPGLAAFTLTPGLVRGAGGSAELTLAGDTRTIRLRLDLPSDDFQTYQALLQTGADDTGVAVKGLRASGQGNSRAVVLNLPAALLPDGEYRLALRGTPEGGAAEDVATYNFRVRRS